MTRQVGAAALDTWNKVCLTGGYVEVDVEIPVGEGAEVRVRALVRGAGGWVFW